MRKIYRGSCLCGGVKFSVDGFGTKAGNCHCTMCRKFHGAAYGTTVEVSGLKWLSGEDLLQHYIAQNGTVRTFCKVCGSSLGFRLKGASIDEVELAISTFDGEIPVKIDAQIYTNYKANWCQLQRDLPVFGEGRTAH